MPLRKPTLGYPSRTAAVLALTEQGRKPAEIAAAIGIEPQNVTALLASGRRSPDRRPSQQGKTTVVPVDVLVRLTPAAVARDISVHELIRRLLDEIAFGGMVDAVLDDKPEPAP